MPAPGSLLADELIARTGRAMDSMLAARFPSLVLRGPADPRLEINTLSDVDAADITPSARAGPGPLCGLAPRTADNGR